MADNKQKNLDSSQNSAISVAESPAAQPEKNIESKAPEKKRAFVSAGEKIHHWTTYLSVDWIYNATVGAMFAYWGKFTPSGQKLWSNPINKGFNFVLKPFLKNEAHLNEAVKQGNTFMSIIAGGMLTIPPLLALENGKIKTSIVKAIDRVIYGKKKVEEDPKFQQAYDEIEHQPKKDFWTGMTSRFAALAPLLALVLYPKTKDWLVENVFKHVGAASKKTVAAVGMPAEKLFKKFPAKEQKARWNYIHDDAVAMDLSFGLPYAVLHAFFYNMFAKAKYKDKKEQDHGNFTEINNSDVPVAPVDSVAPISQQPAQTFAGNVEKKEAIIGRKAIASHDSFTDFAQKTSEKEPQVAL